MRNIRAQRMSCGGRASAQQWRHRRMNENNGTQLKALVVDDDPVIVHLLTAFLEHQGHQVHSAADGAEALARLEAENDFRLVLTDRHMPGLDGLALCRAIRARTWPSYLYCIMLTAATEEDSLVAAMEAGVDDFVGKPLRLGELGARLRAAQRVLALEAGLAQRNRSLAEAYGLLSRELELARTLQLNQLPAPESFGRFGFDWLFEASSYVGGDTFDYFQLDAHHLCFYLADIAGHGIAAAMLAFNARHQIEAATRLTAGRLLRHGSALGTAAVVALDEYNRRFLELREPSLYVTVAYGLLDTRTGRVAMVSAGHPPALLSPAPGEPWVEVGDGGMPVGILEQPDFEAHEFELAPGARLALYSDGITELCDAVGQTFGPARLRQALAASASPAHLREQFAAFRGEVAAGDDVTLLMLEAR